MDIEILDDFDMVGQMDWDSLLARASTRTLVQSWAWQKEWWRTHACHGRELCLVAGRENGRLKVVAPFFIENKVLRFIGDGNADQLDVIYEADCAQDLVKCFIFLKDNVSWKSMECNKVPDASPTWGCLKSASKPAGLFPFAAGKQLVFGGLMDNRHNRILRKAEAWSVVRHARVLASKGSIRVVHSAEPDIHLWPWKDLFIQHIHRWALHPLPSLFVARCERDFLRALAALTTGVKPVLTTLFLNEKPVAYHVGLVQDKVFYSYFFSFDIALRRFSPDEVLWREIVAYAARTGCSRVAFVDSRDPVIRRLAERLGTVRCVKIFRSRHQQWLAKIERWLDKVVIAGMLWSFLRELGQVWVVFWGRRKIVQTCRQQWMNTAAFKDFYDTAAPSFCGRFSVMRPEVELLRRLRPEWKEIRMLDIGVGYGRTGVYFSSVVKSYTAFDQTEAMVNAARGNLDDQLAPRDIFVADARQMSCVVDGAYDLIVFSGNGIDEVSREDRARILQEVRRVGREGAWFFFSSRNLQALMPGRSWGALDFLRRLRRYILMAQANSGLDKLCHQPVASLLDETGGYRLPVQYISPKQQVQELKEMGFHDMRVFSSKTGLEVRDWRRWDKLIDESVYYLCRV